MFANTRNGSEIAGRRAGGAVAVATALLVALSACGEPLSVEDTENVTGSQLGDNIELLVNRALSDFQVSYSGGGLDDEILSVTAVFTDEFYSAGSFSTRTRSDQRNQFTAIQGNTSDNAFQQLQDARVAASEAAAAIADQVGQNDQFAEMKALEGYSILALAENFCGAIPLSTTEDFGPGTQGEPLSTSEAMNEAVARFDAALGAASSGSTEANLAAVGKARALLGLGQISDAASAVSGVPTSFTYFIGHSANSSTQENPMFNLMGNGRYSISDQEGSDDQGPGAGTVPGGNGVAFRHLDGDPSATTADPRIPYVQDPSGGFTPNIPMFINLRYVSRSTDVLLADGIEARLIEAEAAIQNSDFQGAEDILNDLRSNVDALMAARYPEPDGSAYGLPGSGVATGDLGDLTLPTNQADATDVLFKERGFWLFNTGHRLGDLRRLMKAPYNRAESDVFPDGTHLDGIQYGDDVAFQMNFDEVNNENFSLDQCDVTQP